MPAVLSRRWLPPPFSTALSFARCRRTSGPANACARAPEAVCDRVGAGMAQVDPAHLEVIPLRNRDHVMSGRVVTRGDGLRAVVLRAVLLRAAVRGSAPAGTLVPAHPSGDRSPSP